MGLRPAKCYTGTDKPAYTRIAITVPDRNYIGASPGIKIRQFNMGNPTGVYNRVLDLKAGSEIQIRDNAFEAMRMTLNRSFLKTLGKDGYFMKIRIYPHQILRENKQATGAGADRIQKGMSHPFGRPIGRAVRLHANQIILSVLTDEEKVDEAKHLLLKAGPKLGMTVSVRVGNDIQSIGTLPKNVREEAVVEKTTVAVTTEATKGDETKATATTGTGKTESAGKKEEVKTEKSAGKKK